MNTITAFLRTYYRFISIGILGFLFFFAIGIYWWQVRTFPDIIIEKEVNRLAKIFNRINQTAVILSFEHQQNYIDFLTVTGFEGSEIGPMNLKYPKKWEGAYLHDNPTVQEKYYQVIRTKKGYFIVPGLGVRLKNGKIIGKDLILDENADIPAMMQDPEQLQFNGNALAAKIQVG